MPAYDNSPFKPVPQLLIPGQNTYLFGSWPSTIAPSRFQLSNVALATNVAQVTGTVVEGNIPAVGSLISIRGTQSNSGAFNVTNATITAVSITASTGQGTISFALTHADVAIVADAGTAIIPQPEVVETITSGAASIACAIQNNETFLPGGRYVSAYSSTVALKLQGANMDQASEYTDVGACTPGSVTQFGPVDFRFFRFMPTASGTGVARIAG